MKKLYLLFYCCLFTVCSFSQGYYPMLDSVSNDWYSIMNVMPVRVQQSPNCQYGQLTGTTTHRFTSGDTLIGGISWKILDDDDYFPGYLCRYGYIREDTAAGKIYFMDNLLNPEVLLYDFSMQIGDTITRTFYQPLGYYQDGTYTLDSIGTININAGSRRIFYLNNHQVLFHPTLQWIESVGHPGDLDYLNSCNMFGGLLGFACNDGLPRDYCRLLTCFEHNAQKVYFDSCSHAMAMNNWCFNYEDSCNYWNICGFLAENNLISEIKISPNPVSETTTLFVESKTPAHAKVEVLNIYGSRVIETETNISQGKNEQLLDLRKMHSGIYFVTIKTGNETVAGKLVKL